MNGCQALNSPLDGSWTFVCGVEPAEPYAVTDDLRRPIAVKLCDEHRRIVTVNDAVRPTRETS